MAGEYGSGELTARAASKLATSGLILRGALNLSDDEFRPLLATGRYARGVLLVGHAGAGYWEHFCAWRVTHPDGLSDPLDKWSRLVLGGVADEVGAAVLMPADRPFAPFQQWAMRAEMLKASPLGLLIHEDYGLWHAYRGALLFDHEVPATPQRAACHPCVSCIKKPCLSACPVGAFDSEIFAYEACVAHIHGKAGKACRTGGCLARNACPVGTGYRYPVEVQVFHQAAFAGL